MKKVWNSGNINSEIKKGGGGFLAFCGSIGTFLFLNDKRKEGKEKIIIIPTEKSKEQAILIKEQAQNKYIDINELSKDIEKSKIKAENLKNDVKSIKNNRGKD